MIPNRLSRRATLRILACLLIGVVALLPAVAGADSGGFYRQTNLVSDMPGMAPTVDPNLVNAWGMSRSATSPWWVSDNGTGVTTLYDGAGAIRPLVVTIPPPPGAAGPSKPTGQVFNTSNTAYPDRFVVSAGGKSGPASFIFATEDGTISAWNPNVDRTHAILVADRSSHGAIYKGLAMASSRNRDFLYATDFHNGMVDVFDQNFRFIGSFTDRELTRTCPMPGQCFAPFGIQNVEGRLVVTFALQDAAQEDDVHGPGNGFVDFFNVGGRVMRRFASHGPLNSPWGIALAPDNFGRFSGALLIGNFGDGRINAFDPRTEMFLGSLQDSQGQAISIDGLWGLMFGNGAAAGPVNTLYFTAGPNDEANGLFGKIEAMSGG